jgi:hypothetical protein
VNLDTESSKDICIVGLEILEMDSLSFSDLVSKILRELPNQFGLDKETMPGSYELWSYKKTYVSNEGSGDFRRRKKN